LPALYQDDDDGNDLSDLGLSTGKKHCPDYYDEDDVLQDRAADGRGAEERALHQLGHQASEAPAAGGDRQEEEEDVFRGAEEPVAAAVRVATVQTVAAVAATIEPAVPENGYDRAIRDYVDFTESKRISAAKCEEQSTPGRKFAVAEIRRRMSAPKIEEKVMLLKTRSQSTKDLNAAVNELPKVDIGKRREIFEKICSETKAADVQHNIVARQSSKKVLKASPIPSSPTSVAAAAVDVFRQQDVVVEDISPPESPLPGMTFSNLRCIYV